MPTRTYAAIISQFLHGERATIAMCRRLTTVIDDPDVRRFLETQIADESRHAAAYAAYLARLGGPVPMDPALTRAFDRALAWRGSPQALLLGFHVLLEGEALRTMADFKDCWPCPVFADLNGRISRDEARHVAFGKIFLSQTLPQIDPAERREMADWVRALWQESAEAVLGGIRVPGLFTRGLRRRWLADGAAQHDRAFRDIGFSEWLGIPATA